MSVPSRPAFRLRSALGTAGVLAVVAIGVIAANDLLSPVTQASAPTVTSPLTHPLESMLQDDRYLIYSSTATVSRTLDALAALGVDRLRVTVLWSAIAPGVASRVRPTGFDAVNPAAYPPSAWAPYDRLLVLARARGIEVDFDVTAPGPLWAMRAGAPAPAQADHYAPSAAEFGQFVLAVGRRYSGSYIRPGRQAALPRVGYWSIWNEPNQPGWLAPQRVTTAGGLVVQSARLYRDYVDAAVASLRRSGHGADTILIGELAPEGDEGAGASQPVPPIPFLQALYCVDSNYRPLRGTAAQALGCPGGRQPSVFVSAHPGLFRPTGFAHHPYSFFLPPSAGMSDPNFVPLSDLGRLEHALDVVFSAYTVARRLPLYLTEYGYETNPPNPFRGVSPGTQAAYLDQGEYLAWRDSRVRTLSQFLLYDAPPNPKYPRGSFGYWSTFQTGLVYLRGVAKPSLFSYRIPIFIPSARFANGGDLTVWGMLRLAANGTQQRARIEWRPATGGVWRTLEYVVTRNSTGVLLASVAPPGSGTVRIALVSLGGVAYSREVAVHPAGG